MPLVLDPERLPPKVLAELRRSLREDLDQTLEAVAVPRGPVLDPTSLETARELVQAAIDTLDRSTASDAKALAGEANLAYATMLAAIDLVKSHTGVSRVPAPRPRSDTPDR